MTHLRKSAANLRAIQSCYEANELSSHDFRERMAWNEAQLRLSDAIDAMEEAADEIEGIWKLPLRFDAPMRVGGGIGR